MVPTFTLVVGGVDVSSNFKSRALSIDITDGSGTESDTINISLSDADGRLALPRQGALISASLGWNGNNKLVGVYEVEDVDCDLDGDQHWEMSIYGKAASQREALKEHRTEDYQDTTVGDILNKIAGRHGLTPAIDGDMAGLKLEYLGQSEESDQNIMTRLARRYGATATVKNNRLMFIKKGQGQSSSGAVLGVSAIPRSSIISCSASLKSKPRFGTIQTSYLDRKTGLEKIVEQTTGEGPKFIIRHPFTTEDEALKATGARARELSRAENSCAVTVFGNTGYLPDTKVTLSGLREGVDGTWTADQVSHNYDDSGFFTTLDLVQEPEDKSSSSGSASSSSSSDTSSTETSTEDASSGSEYPDDYWTIKPVPKL